MRLTIPCPQCIKPLVLTHEYKLSDKTSLKQYKCGHIFHDTSVSDRKELQLSSVNGDKKARLYQETGVDFIVNSTESNQPFNCIIGDQQRLGKTPQALLALASDYKNRTPCLILVRAANLYQWIREYKIWCDSLPLGIYPIQGTKGFIPVGFSCYIMSMDTFSRIDLEKLLSLKFKLCIVDECHSFKNTDSKRSQALVQFLHEITKSTVQHIVPFFCSNCKHTWDETVTVNTDTKATTSKHSAYCPKCNAWNSHTTQKEKINLNRNCGLVMLSGTTIKNQADEIFIPLNLVAPEKFPSKEHLRRKWMYQDKGKWRIHPHLIESFREEIAPFFLRREKEDVYTDLPPLNRIFTVMRVEDELLKKAYNKVLDTIEENMGRGNYSFFSNIGELSQLRQICGLAKVDWAADYIKEYVEDTDKDDIKIAVGLHHYSVADRLKMLCNDLGVLKLDGKSSAEQKDWIMTSFEHDHNHVLLINMLAGGVGMDFHYCPNVLCLERQWSYADEEQFEYRFYNPDKSIMGDRSTNIEYPICEGTTDEFFYDLVEQKRVIFGETLSKNWDLMNDSDSFKNLLERTVGSRL